MTRLDFGLFLDLPTETETIGARMGVSRPLVDLAMSVGFSSVWAGESYPRGGGGFQHVPAPMLALASLLDARSLALGTGVTIAPAWTPLRLAYDALVMDHLTGGRFELGLGLGSAPTWAQFGIDPATVGDLVDEMILGLKAVWSGAPGYEGRLVTIPTAIGPAPVRPGGPPIRVGGKIARSARRAALADGFLAGTHFHWDLVLTQIGRYRAALGERGEDPAAAHVSVNRIVVLADDAEAAWRDAGASIGRLLRSYAKLRMFPGWEALLQADPSDHTALRAAAAGMCLVGSPAEVRAQLDGMAAAGVRQVQVRPMPGGLDPALAARTIERFGREVVPDFM